MPYIRVRFIVSGTHLLVLVVEPSQSLIFYSLNSARLKIEC